VRRFHLCPERLLDAQRHVARQINLRVQQARKSIVSNLRATKCPQRGFPRARVDPVLVRHTVYPLVIAIHASPSAAKQQHSPMIRM
jgi:hypothetical protein